MSWVERLKGSTQHHLSQHSFKLLLLDLLATQLSKVSAMMMIKNKAFECSQYLVPNFNFYGKCFNLSPNFFVTTCMWAEFRDWKGPLSITLVSIRSSSFSSICLLLNSAKAQQWWWWWWRRKLLNVHSIQRIDLSLSLISLVYSFVHMRCHHQSFILSTHVF